MSSTPPRCCGGGDKFYFSSKFTDNLNSAVMGTVHRPNNRKPWATGYAGFCPDLLLMESLVQEKGVLLRTQLFKTNLKTNKTIIRATEQARYVGGAAWVQGTFGNSPREHTLTPAEQYLPMQMHFWGFRAGLVGNAEQACVLILAATSKAAMPCYNMAAYASNSSAVGRGRTLLGLGSHQSSSRFSKDPAQGNSAA